MKQIYLFLMLLSGAGLASGQEYLSPNGAYKIAYYLEDVDDVQVYDGETEFYYVGGSVGIIRISRTQLEDLDTYLAPADYATNVFPGFLNISPDGSTLWAGYTVSGNTDDRIYTIDTESGTWTLMATFPGNFDLEIWKDTILVSGLNSTSWSAPNAIWLLDGSGANAHRKIIETGGSSAGLAVDDDGNLYFGSSVFGDNGLYRWTASQVQAVVDDPGAATLSLVDAEKLSTLPNGANDVEVDEAGHLLFTMNEWEGIQVLGQWNGTAGDAANYDTLATTPDWLGMVKSIGDYTRNEPGNGVYTKGYGQPIADLHAFDYPPYFFQSLPTLYGEAGSDFSGIDLGGYCMDIDDRTGISFSVELSVEGVSSMSISDSTLEGSFSTEGQSNYIITASSGAQTMSAKGVIGTWEQHFPETVADMDELSLTGESFWNGSDQSGSFRSDAVVFHNDYNSEYFSWSGWAYSNSSDATTPGFMNQYAAITGEGFNEDENSSGIYAVSSLYGPAAIGIEDQMGVEGFYVTNSTYAALSMEHGDNFAKRFGGTDGRDPDYFKLIVKGFFQGTEFNNVVEFYLADYRFANSDEDYILKTWQWVDLDGLAGADSLVFDLESSDVGDWGMNTPAFFCLDDLGLFHYDSRRDNESSLLLQLYPNPAGEQVRLDFEGEGSGRLRIFRMNGQLVLDQREYHSGNELYIGALGSGLYLVSLETGEGLRTTRFVKK